MKKCRVSKAIRYIENNLTESIGIEEVCQNCNISSWHFQREFKRKTSISLGKYIRMRKLSYAIYCLYFNKMSVTKISEFLAYSATESFSRSFKEFFGASPNEFSKKPDVRILKSSPAFFYNISLYAGVRIKVVEPDKVKMLFRAYDFKYRYMCFEEEFIKGLDVFYSADGKSATEWGDRILYVNIFGGDMTPCDINWKKKYFCVVMKDIDRDALYAVRSYVYSYFLSDVILSAPDYDISCYERSGLGRFNIEFYVPMR